MNSQKHEEVRKRRGKASTSRLNLYQKTGFVVGVLILLFLAIGRKTLLIFRIFRNLTAKKEWKNKAALQETLPEAEEALEPEPISSRADEEIIADSPAVISEPTNSDTPQDSISPEPEEAVTTPETPPVEKEDLSPAEEFSGDGVLAQIQERLAMVEEKVSRLEDRVMDLEEKAARYQEGQLKSEPQIDLQTILSHLDEKEGKIV